MLKHLNPTELCYDDKGLIPTIIQDIHTNQVLMLAYTNKESLELSLASGETWFWSRSRKELWHKGAISGNKQRIMQILVDCDADTLLMLVEPAGPACHTGKVSCFYQELGRESQGGDT